MYQPEQKNGSARPSFTLDNLNNLQHLTPTDEGGRTITIKHVANTVLVGQHLRRGLLLSRVGANDLQSSANTKPEIILWVVGRHQSKYRFRLNWAYWLYRSSLHCRHYSSVLVLYCILPSCKRHKRNSTESLGGRGCLFSMTAPVFLTFKLKLYAWKSCDGIRRHR